MTYVHTIYSSDNKTNLNICVYHLGQTMTEFVFCRLLSHIIQTHYLIMSINQFLLDDEIKRKKMTGNHTEMIIAHKQNGP
ncbi:unnamed protein product [Rotaria socialis]